MKKTEIRMALKRMGETTVAKLSKECGAEMSKFKNDFAIYVSSDPEYAKLCRDACRCLKHSAGPIQKVIDYLKVEDNGVAKRFGKYEPSRGQTLTLNELESVRNEMIKHGEFSVLSELALPYMRDDYCSELDAIKIKYEEKKLVVLDSYLSLEMTLKNTSSGDKFLEWLESEIGINEETVQRFVPVKEVVNFPAVKLTTSGLGLSLIQ